jgi:hypothetical protein
VPITLGHAQTQRPWNANMGRKRLYSSRELEKRWNMHTTPRSENNGIRGLTVGRSDISMRSQSTHRGRLSKRAEQRSHADQKNRLPTCLLHKCHAVPGLDSILAKMDHSQPYGARVSRYCVIISCGHNHHPWKEQELCQIPVLSSGVAPKCPTFGVVSFQWQILDSGD